MEREDAAFFPSEAALRERRLRAHDDLIQHPLAGSDQTNSLHRD